MQLPFTENEFLDLFALYNRAFWPVLVALWLASLAVSVRLLSADPPGGRIVSALLAVHWGWSALAYHAVFFTSINPAAWLFAALFLVQSGVFLWTGVVKGRLSFVPSGTGWTPLAWTFVAYSLVYPAINAGQHMDIWRIPGFGVPCPTTIFTAGLLLLAGPPSWRVALIPVIWSAIGGSAAVLLDVRADFALPVAGAALAAAALTHPSHMRPTVTAPRGS